jgi:hypothetical protein
VAGAPRSARRRRRGGATTQLIALTDVTCCCMAQVWCRQKMSRCFKREGSRVASCTFVRADLCDRRLTWWDCARAEAAGRSQRALV